MTLGYRLCPETGILTMGTHNDKIISDSLQ